MPRKTANCSGTIGTCRDLCVDISQFPRRPFLSGSGTPTQRVRFAIVTPRRVCGGRKRGGRIPSKGEGKSPLKALKIGLFEIPIGIGPRNSYIDKILCFEPVAV
jgi:hypothetical protein